MRVQAPLLLDCELAAIALPPATAAVLEIQDFGEWKEVSPEVSALAGQREGGAKEPHPLTSSYPARFANLSLIDSISYVLAVTEHDREAVQGYLATLGAPNQLLQLSSLLQPA